MDYAHRAMFVIDENVSELEVLRLRKAGIRVRLIGEEVARTWDADENLLPILLKLKKPVLFTRIRTFFSSNGYIRTTHSFWLDVHPNTVADFVQEFLRHPEFDTQGKRMGTVARAGVSGIRYWRAGNRQLRQARWLGPIL